MDSELSSRLERAVTLCEEQSDVEVVVVIANQSGPYGDIQLMVGLVLALLGSLFIVFSPFVFNPFYLVPSLVVLICVGAVLAKKLPFLLRWFTSFERRKRQVEAAAEVAFYRQSISLTRRRTGLLVYFSLLERDGHLLGDVALRRSVPGDCLGKLQVALDEAANEKEPLEALVRFLEEKLKEPLARFLPAKEDNPNELPNSPVWIHEMGPGS